MQNFTIVLAGLSVGLAAYALLSAGQDLADYFKARARIKRRLAEIDRMGGNVRWRIIERGDKSG
jgi:hypothetical protein